MLLNFRSQRHVKQELCEGVDEQRSNLPSALTLHSTGASPGLQRDAGRLFEVGHVAAFNKSAARPAFLVPKRGF